MEGRGRVGGKKRVLCWAILPVTSCSKRKSRQTTGIINRKIVKKIPCAWVIESASDINCAIKAVYGALTENWLASVYDIEIPAILIEADFDCAIGSFRSLSRFC